MKCILAALVVLVAVAQAKPPQSTLGEKIDAYLTSVTSKRALNAREAPLCSGQPCCEVKTCAHGDCIDEEGDNMVYEFGYQCMGSDCGTGDGQYCGIGCDIPQATACDACDADTDSIYCMKSTVTLSGVICYGEGYSVLNSREIDIMFGLGASEEVSRITRDVKNQHSDMEGLLKRLLAKLN